VDLGLVEHAVDPSPFRAVSISGEIAGQQEIVAGRFCKPRLISKPIVVQRIIVWTWRPVPDTRVTRGIDHAPAG
jgi:hypothetical protein